MIKHIFALIVVAIVSVAFVGCGNNDVKETKTVAEKHIYDTAKVVDIKNGTGKDVIGKVSVLEVNSSDVTREALEDWFFNYVKKNIGAGDKWNWAVIVYKDKKGMGTFCNGSMMVQKNVPIEKNKNDDAWSLNGNEEETLIEDSDNPGHLKKFDPNEKPKTQNVSPTGEPFTVTMNHSITKVGDNKYQIVGTTNLPDNAELIISLSNDNYRGSDKKIVAGGKFSATLSGQNLTPGEYDLSITMSIARNQKGVGVKERIGEFGENMQGEYVEKALTKDNVVRYEKKVQLD